MGSATCPSSRRGPCPVKSQYAALRTRETGPSYKSGTLLIALASVWVRILVNVARRADLRAVDIVGVNGLALLVGLEGGVLLNDFHDAWYLRMTGVQKVEGTHSKGGSQRFLYVLWLACAVCVSLGNGMDLARVDTTTLLVLPEPHGAVGWHKSVDLTWPVNSCVRAWRRMRVPKRERRDYFAAPPLGASGCCITLPLRLSNLSPCRKPLTLHFTQRFTNKAARLGFSLSTPIPPPGQRIGISAAFPWTIFHHVGL
jgi:hypothetical protein